LHLEKHTNQPNTKTKTTNHTAKIDVDQRAILEADTGQIKTCQQPTNERLSMFFTATTMLNIRNN